MRHIVIPRYLAAPLLTNFIAITVILESVILCLKVLYTLTLSITKTTKLNSPGTYSLAKFILTAYFASLTFVVK